MAESTDTITQQPDLFVPEVRVVPEWPVAQRQWTGAKALNHVGIGRRFEEPKSIADLQLDRLLAPPSAGRVSEAQYDLGGNLDRYDQSLRDGDRWGPFIEDYEPGKVDIAEGFERFDLTMLTVEEIQNMTQKERKRLADEFVIFTRRTASRAAVLRASNGDALSPLVADHYANFIKTDIDAQHYGIELAAFHRMIAGSAVYEKLLDIAGRQRADDLRRFRMSKSQRDHKKPPAAVSYDTQYRKYRFASEVSDPQSA